MKLDIITLFPEQFDSFLTTSIIGKAIEKNKVEIKIHNLREYTLDPRKKVDDYGYGGGEGMVLMIEPVYRAIQALAQKETKTILLTPQGETFHQQTAYDLSKEKHIILICGHYEGFDERIRNLVDREISIGDFVLTGGEIPAMAIADAIVRLLDGVIKKESHINDSFHEHLLDYPVYTKPKDFMGMKVPDILFSGHHAKIQKWRHDAQIEKTKARRPDLLEKRGCK